MSTDKCSEPNLERKTKAFAPARALSYLLGRGQGSSTSTGSLECWEGGRELEHGVCELNLFPHLVLLLLVSPFLPSLSLPS